jgi:hypothetical protein
MGNFWHLKMQYSDADLGERWLLRLPCSGTGRLEGLKVSHDGLPSLSLMYMLSVMIGDIRILTVELDGDDRLEVTFSDGTIGVYVVEELLKVTPRREPVAEKFSEG